MNHEHLATYCRNLFNSIPLGIYVTVVLLVVFSTLYILTREGREKKLQTIAEILASAYAFLLYYSTVLGREYLEKEPEFRLFWSYEVILSKGRIEIIHEVLMNIVVFVPLGFLLGMAFWKKHWWMVLLAGCSLSVIIEASQYFLKRGLCELDDVFNNAVGCALGIMLSMIIMKICVFSSNLYKLHSVKRRD